MYRYGGAALFALLLLSLMGRAQGVITGTQMFREDYCDLTHAETTPGGALFVAGTSTADSEVSARHLDYRLLSLEGDGIWQGSFERGGMSLAVVDIDVSDPTGTLVLYRGLESGVDIFGVIEVGASGEIVNDFEIDQRITFNFFNSYYNVLRVGEVVVIDAPVRVSAGEVVTRIMSFDAGGTLIGSLDVDAEHAIDWSGVVSDEETVVYASSYSVMAVGIGGESPALLSRVDIADLLPGFEYGDVATFFMNPVVSEGGAAYISTTWEPGGQPTLITYGREAGGFDVLSVETSVADTGFTGLCVLEEGALGLIVVGGENYRRVRVYPISLADMKMEQEVMTSETTFLKGNYYDMYYPEYDTKLSSINDVTSSGMILLDNWGGGPRGPVAEVHRFIDTNTVRRFDVGCFDPRGYEEGYVWRGSTVVYGDSVYQFVSRRDSHMIAVWPLDRSSPETVLTVMPNSGLTVLYDQYSVVHDGELLFVYGLETFTRYDSPNETGYRVIDRFGKVLADFPVPGRFPSWTWGNIARGIVSVTSEDALNSPTCHVGYYSFEGQEIYQFEAPCEEVKREFYRPYLPGSSDPGLTVYRDLGDESVLIALNASGEEVSRYTFAEPSRVFNVFDVSPDYAVLTDNGELKLLTLGDGTWRVSDELPPLPAPTEQLDVYIQIKGEYIYAFSKEYVGDYYKTSVYALDLANREMGWQLLVETDPQQNIGALSFGNATLDVSHVYGSQGQWGPITHYFDLGSLLTFTSEQVVSSSPWSPINPAQGQVIVLGDAGDDQAELLGFNGQRHALLRQVSKSRQRSAYHLPVSIKPGLYILRLGGRSQLLHVVAP